MGSPTHAMPYNSRSLANLRPIQPGQRLNPQGVNGASKARKADERCDAIMVILRETHDEELREELMREFARRIVDGALAEDVGLVRRLLDRVYPVPRA